MSLTAVTCFVIAVFLTFVSTNGGRVLELPDSLLGISSRNVFCLIEILLLGVSAFLLVSRNIQMRLGLLLWLSCNLLVYHFGRVYYGGANRVARLGNLSPLIPIAPQTTNLLVSVFLISLFLSSGSLLAADWLSRKKANMAKEATIPAVTLG